MTHVPGRATGLAAAALAAVLLAAAPHALGAPAGVQQRCRDVPGADDPQLRAARTGRCLETALAFDPSNYFDDPGERWSPDEPGGIVDARYESSLHGPRWSFAINPVCASGGGRVGCPADRLQLLMRVVAWKTPTELPPGYHVPLHGTLGESLRVLDVAASWREADLKTCPGAVAALLSLENARWFDFDDADRDAIAGREVDSLTVVADGDFVTVRAQGFAASTYAASTLGEEAGTSGWAQQMLKVVEPCLKPASAPPPWRRPPAQEPAR